MSTLHLLWKKDFSWSKQALLQRHAFPVELTDHIVYHREFRSNEVLLPSYLYSKLVIILTIDFEHNYSSRRKVAKNRWQSLFFLNASYSQCHKRRKTYLYIQSVLFSGKMIILCKPDFWNSCFRTEFSTDCLSSDLILQWLLLTALEILVARVIGNKHKKYSNINIQLIMVVFNTVYQHSKL